MQLSIGSTDLNTGSQLGSEQSIEGGDYRVSSHEVEPGLQWLPWVPLPPLIATLNLDSFQLREVQGLGVDSQEFEFLWGPFMSNFLSHPLTNVFPSLHWLNL